MWLPRQLFSLFAGLMTTLGMLGNVFAEIKITSIEQNVGIDSVLSSTVWVGGVLTLVLFLCIRNNKAYMQHHQIQLKPFFKEVLRVLSSYSVWIVGLIGALLYTSLSVFGELWGQTYLQQAHHLSKVQSAQTMSMLFIGWAIGAPLSGYLSDKFANRVMPLFIGAVGGMISIYCILYLDHLSYSSLKWLVLFYGIFTSTEIIVFAMAKELSGVKISGTVFAVTNMIVTLLGAVLQPSVGWILDIFGHRVWVVDHFHYQIQDYRLALSLLPIALFLVILMCLKLRDTNKGILVS
jgi:sugar phosphate permease